MGITAVVLAKAAVLPDHAILLYRPLSTGIFMEKAMKRVADDRGWYRATFELAEEVNADDFEYKVWVNLGLESQIWTMGPLMYPPEGTIVVVVHNMTNESSQGKAATAKHPYRATGAPAQFV